MTTLRQIINERDERNEAILLELAFDQFEFDSKIKFTVKNYDLIREVFTYAFKKGREL